ncbi:hypothetical protein HWV62_4617 [Athelia sp. TMB]|nr:hypothetical protein HWV62_4617 [Athelia sp. TMB]
MHSPSTLSASGPMGFAQYFLNAHADLVMNVDRLAICEKEKNCPLANCDASPYAAIRIGPIALCDAYCHPICNPFDQLSFTLGSGASRVNFPSTITLSHGRWTYPLLAEHTRSMASASASTDLELLKNRHAMKESVGMTIWLWYVCPGARNTAVLTYLSILRHYLTAAQYLSRLLLYTSRNYLNGRMYMRLTLLCDLLPNCLQSTAHSDVALSTLRPRESVERVPDEVESLGLSNHVGGGQAYTFREADFIDYMVDEYADRLGLDDDCLYSFHSHLNTASAGNMCAAHDNLIAVIIPLDKLVMKLTVGQILSVVQLHGITLSKRRLHVDAMREALRGHSCNHCEDLVTLIKPARRAALVPDVSKTVAVGTVGPSKHTKKGKGASKKTTSRPRKRILGRKKDRTREWKKGKVAKSRGPRQFPPTPLDLDERAEIVSRFCRAQRPEMFEEVGCAVCGQLVKKSDSLSMREAAIDTSLLHGLPGSTRKERTVATQPIEEIVGPVIDKTCTHVCNDCHGFLDNGRVPINALANGLWVGDVPEALRDLTFAEKILIARVRHNRCVVKVQSGMWKTHANAVTFANPIQSVYNTLPPTIADVDEVLAFIYIGQAQPSEDDLKKTPMIVRRSRVAAALEWLKLNNEYYADLNISYINLATYPEHGCPFVYDFYKRDEVRDVDALATNDEGEEQGTAQGECSFVVHGLMESDLMPDSGKTWKELKAVAVQHLADGGHVLAVGHSNEPVRTFDNPSLYPRMFPCLFPYGKGGLDQPQHKHIISSATRKKWLLQYHDKRFQAESLFTLIGLNHEQIKQSRKGGRVIANKKDFPDISDRLLGLDLSVLEAMIKKMSDGEHISDPSPAETLCFRVMRDLDLVGQHVQGSFTNKRFMRHEIWSLIEFLGAPSWFITFSPADERSPICLYFADTNEKFSPNILTKDARRRLIAQNPVAGAKFFDFIVKSFVRNVLGVGRQGTGLYGKMSAYYGTVEQQGRLTLHLHLLLWIRGALTPQEIRDRMLDPDGVFQTDMVRYLEAAHQGEFASGDLATVKRQVAAAESKPGYLNPTLTLADPPPVPCGKANCIGCGKCEGVKEWWKKAEETTDDLLLKSNMHRCDKNCWSSEAMVCKSRFPREVVRSTLIDQDSGSLKIKKLEPRMNTFSRNLTYMLRCNSDVTSLLSGTALKAVVAYVTEYVTKCGLKTYHIFDAVRNTIQKNGELIGGDTKRQEKAKSLMTKIVNSLTSKSEIGAPLAALYLLGNPDHYTSHEFRSCYWKNYVRKATGHFLKAEYRDPLPGELHEEKVTVRRDGDRYVGVSYVDDYVFRPQKWEDMNLYTWIRLAVKNKMSKAERALIGNDQPDNQDSADEHSDMCDGNDLADIVEDECESEPGNTGEGDGITDDLFMPGHPERTTHRIKVAEDDGTIVPNFMGGNLPRCDKGDREEYCSTMLTLFKPWRSGADLKSEPESWDDAFHKHEFSAECKEKLKNFNVKYECLDARDDFHAQRKAMENGMPRGAWFTEFPRERDDEIVGDNYMPEADLKDFIDKFGKSTAKGEMHRLSLAKNMAEIKRILLTSGWLDSCLEGPAEADDDVMFRPDAWQAPAIWQAAVQAKKQAVIADRLRGMKNTKLKKNSGPISKVFDNEYRTDGDVQIVDKAWLDAHFHTSDPENDELIARIERDAGLNNDQKRAFRIIANHASAEKDERLQMYLGGMGGTGKSRVIKALVDFFTARDERHRFLVLAPTGSAAALLSGSTYHSVLGIYEGKDDRGETLKERMKVRASLEGVEYIFLDEVSMLSCKDMYRISEAASKALGMADEAFGGINMIFAGDFAQLPPVGGSKEQVIRQCEIGVGVEDEVV